MRIKVFGNDSWCRLRALPSPDRQMLEFNAGHGEFSLSRAIRFEKHLARYPQLNKYYSRLNGKRIRAVLKDEPAFFGIRGLEELIYK